MVQMPEYPFDEKTGYVELPKIFNRSYRSGYRRVLERNEEQGDTQRVWYLDPIRGEIEALATEEAFVESEEEGEGDDAD
jgi:hypothetical protein